MQPSKDRSPLRRLLASRRWRKDEPESKPAALDVAGFDKLEASLNELSKAAATQSLTYLLLWLYLAFTVASVTDYDLLIENPIKLPIFNLEIGLIAFFIAAPPLFWLVQLYMVRKLAVIGEAVDEYLAAAKQQAESAGADAMAVLERLRHRADGFVITRLLARFDDIVLSDGRRGPPSSDLAAALTVLAAGATLIVAPLLLYFGFQIRFLAYQSEPITWWHRAWVLAGLMLCAAAGRTAKLSWGHTFRAVLILLLHLIGLIRLCHYLRLPDWRAQIWVARPIGLLSWTVPAAVLGLTSLTVLTFPGETMSDDERLAEWGMGGDLAKSFRIPRSLMPIAPFDQKSIADALRENNKLDIWGPPPLDLRHRDFSYRNLQGANFSGAWIQGINFLYSDLKNANFTFADLEGAHIGYTELQEANFSGANLQGANFSGANLHDSRITGSNAQGANFADAKMLGADLTKGQLQGARFDGAILQGANLTGANLQGAYFFDAKLQGANLWEAQLQGADFSGAQLQGANLVETAWWRARVNSAQLDHAYISPRQDGNLDQDSQSPNETDKLINGHLMNSNANQRTNYLADIACNIESKKLIIKGIIDRSSNRGDISAASLSDRLKDVDRCPAARELSADDWKSLARNVEQEKAATSSHE